MADTPNEVADELIVAPMNLTDRIVADTNAALVQSSSTQTKLLTNLGLGQTLINGMTQIQSRSAEDRAIITSAQQAADLKAQQYRINIANKAGVDPSQASDFLLDTVGKFSESAKKVQERQAIITQKRDSKFLDNPVQWITDAITLPMAYADLNAAVDATNTYGTQIQQVSNIVSQGSNVSLQIKESTTAASAQAASRVAADEAALGAYKTAFEGLKFNTDVLNASMGMTKDRLALQYNEKQMAQQEQAQKIVLSKFENEKYEFSERQDDRRAIATAKAEGKTVDDYQLEMINTGRGNRGLPALTGPAVKSALQIFKAGGEGSKEMLMDYRNGERTKITGNTFIGGSAAESVDNITKYQFDFPPGVERTLKILERANTALAADPKMVGVKDEKLRDKYINDFVNAQVIQMFNAPTKTPDNLFYVGDISNYFAVDAVKQLPVVQKLFGPSSAAGVKLDDPGTVLKLGVSAVQRGDITSTEFQDIATVYQMTNNLAIRAANPLGFGISLPSGGSRLLVGNGLFKDPTEVTNPVSLGRYLSEQLAAGMVKQQQGEITRAYGAPGTPNAMRRLMQEKNPFSVNQGN